MSRTLYLALITLLASAFMSGCVAKSDYLIKVAEAGRTQELKTCNLEKENSSPSARNWRRC